MTTTPTTPASSPLDTLKALSLQNIGLLEFVSDLLGGSEQEIDEVVFDVLDNLKDMQHKALGEHVGIETVQIGPMPFPRIADDGFIYDDGTPVRESFKTPGMTSHFFPRYDGSRELALARHYEAAAEQQRGFADELAARAEGREWSPVEENAAGNAEGCDDQNDLHEDTGPGR